MAILDYTVHRSDDADDSMRYIYLQANMDKDRT